MTNLIYFANNHPLYFLLCLAVAAWALVQPLRYAFLCYNRRLRSLNIREKGWPPPPLDADGDVDHDL